MPPPRLGSRRWYSTPSRVPASCTMIWLRRSPGNTSMIRSMDWAESLVCSVVITRWPVSAMVRAADMDSRSRISPTSTTSGSSRRTALRAFSNDSVSVPTSRWLTAALWFSWRYSIGSSMVMMWQRRFLLRTSIIDAIDVDFPDPVGPVTRISPLGLRRMPDMACGSPSSSGEGMSMGMRRRESEQAPRW